jgi:alkylation response protein AidB-like acyl-CoA dehydrogenase
VDLAFTDEQQALREAVRDACAASCPIERVRELEDDPVGFDAAFWRELGQMDLLGLSLPEEHGGSGMGPLESVIVAEELGRALVPSPYLVSCVAAGTILAQAGTPEQRSAWLPDIATGASIVTLAWHEAQASDGPRGVHLSVRDDADELVLDGTKVMVPFALGSSALLVLARRGERLEDIDLVLVDRDADGLTIEHTPTLASDAACRVTFAGVRVPAASRLGAAGSGWSAFRRAMDQTLIVAAGWAVGGAERTLEMTVAYAKERVQFGVPIGNFQGVAHPIADIATEIEGARTLVHQAAWSREAGPLPAMAKRYAADVYRRATRVAHQTFGGVGFTIDIDVQLYFRRAKQHDLLWFGGATLDEEIAAAELDAPTPFVSIDAGV